MAAAAMGLLLVAPAAVGATINGTAQADVLRGTDRADVIRARAGDDSVFARGGNDRVRPGRGRDVIHLGPGADRVFVDVRTLTSYRMAGRDRIYGGPGPDVTDNVWFADLGPGNDHYLVRWSCHRAYLGRGDDRATNPGGWNGVRSCSIHGGPGRDLLRWDGTDAPGSHYVTTLDGGEGADTLHGGWNEDALIGGPGADSLHPDEFTEWGDHVYAGDGNDHIYLANAEEGTAPIEGGPGVDTVHDWDGERVLHGIEIVNP